MRAVVGPVAEMSTLLLREAVPFFLQWRMWLFFCGYSIRSYIPIPENIESHTYVCVVTCFHHHQDTHGSIVDSLFLRFRVYIGVRMEKTIETTIMGLY